MAMEAKLSELREERRRLSEQIHANAKELFGNETRAIFEAHPKLESFSWKQYTPYFNDGDECTFRVNNDCLEIKFDGGEFEEISDWTFKRDSRKYNAKEQDTVGLKEAHTSIRQLLNNLEDDDFKLMFGDHVRVTVKSPGVVETEGYSHD